ncbi:unnamed protein product [Calypogeia fissa]
MACGRGRKRVASPDKAAGGNGRPRWKKSRDCTVSQQGEMAEGTSPGMSAGSNARGRGESGRDRWIFNAYSTPIEDHESRLPQRSCKSYRRRGLKFSKLSARERVFHFQTGDLKSTPAHEIPWDFLVTVIGLSPHPVGTLRLI